MRDLCANHLTTDRGAREAPRAGMKLARWALAISVASVALPAAAFDVSYLHTLASTTGVIVMSTPALSYDATGREMYAISGGLVRIFNESGMETYRFGADLIQGHPQALVALDDGDLIALVQERAEFSLIRCNYRGEQVGQVELKGVPERFLTDFHPRVLRRWNDNLYLADLNTMLVLVLRTTGEFVAEHDLGKLVQFSEQERQDNLLGGFNVDAGGNLLFTIPTKFEAFIATPGGEVRRFGMKGSAPGKFQVVNGIAADEAGNIYVSDVLKSAVIVFDKEFHYLREFGFAGGKPSNLIGPVEIVYGNGKLYVSQRARRGVNVYQVTIDG